MAVEEKTKEEIELDHHRKPLIDKSTAFHFLFGCGLGLLLKLLIDIFIIALILGIFLIPTIEYSTHKIFTGYATLKTKNALVDILIAGLGLVLIMLISSINIEEINNIIIELIVISPPPINGVGGGGSGSDVDGEAIPGYNVYIAIGLIGIITVILIKKRRLSLN